MTEDIRFERTHGLGIVVLDRPKALNSLSLQMVAAMDDELAHRAVDESIGAVMVRKSAGRAFAAGGDIQRLYEAGCRGESYTRDFFRREYMLDRRIKRYPKPYIALMDGIVMGGGVGISVHGSHRIVTENTVFAMPETGIGFFPDVGGTYFLPRLPGRLGLWLALTGSRLGGADCLAAGIATHYVPSTALGELERTLADAGLHALGERERNERVSGFLAQFSAEPGAAPVAELMPVIDRLFDGDGVAEVLARLDADGSDWAVEQAATIRGKSPTSLAVAFEQIRRGAALDFDEAMRLEYRISQKFMAGHDFYEGVRAVIVDKDNAPQWRPSTVEDVTAAEVAAYFEPPPDGDLEFRDG